jgi:hypothetical protein
MNGLRARGISQFVKKGKAFRWISNRHYQLNSVATVRERTIPTERPPLVGEVSSKLFSDWGCHEAGALNIFKMLCNPSQNVTRDDYYYDFKSNIIKKTPWSESASELHRPSDRRLSAMWLPTFEDRGRHVVSMTDPYGRILGFLDRSRYFSIK